MSILNPHLRADDGEAVRGMKLRRHAAVASLSVAAALIGVKFIAYMVTDSVSLMSSLMDSTFDALASAVTLFSVIHAATPADEEHRFGHGKLEAVASLAQALFIFGSAAYLFFESIHRFFQPQAVASADIGIGVMLLSMVLTAALIVFQRHVIGKTGSVAIGADHAHYRGDLLMNASVLVSLALSYFSDWPYFDPAFAAGISLFLLKNAFDIGAQSMDILMDKELPDSDRENILRLVSAHTSVLSVHDLRTRHSGHQVFIEFHLEMDGNISLKAAHDITEEIELILYREFPNAEILIHQEPAGLDHHRRDEKLTVPV